MINNDFKKVENIIKNKPKNKNIDKIEQKSGNKNTSKIDYKYNNNFYKLNLTITQVEFCKK